jgi:predicted small secreted protein
LTTEALSSIAQPDIGEGLTMRTLIVIAAATAAMWVSGCNTIAGMGRDVQAAGHAVANTAEDAKR